MRKTAQPANLCGLSDQAGQETTKHAAEVKAPLDHFIHAGAPLRGGADIMLFYCHPMTVIQIQYVYTV
jgi:hypothetical protein